MNKEKFLYEKLQVIDEMNMLNEELPKIIKGGLSEYIVLREYQEKAFKYFIKYFEDPNFHKNKQIHTLFHMATGSGKTVIMAGLILYLYTQGYRKFLFFVNQTNVIEKTIDNFINSLSKKYLFNKEIIYLGNKVNIKKVNNFVSDSLNDEIQICFTSTQKLHLDLQFPKENSLTYEDFEDNKIVFISDESHHINTSTKKETKSEEQERNSWEYSVTQALSKNKDSIMLEFTATADLRDKNVKNKYIDKIIFNYTLKEFRQSGYTKDFQNFATESDLWNRTLMALVMSEYRKYLFNDNKLNIKPVVMLKSQKITESQTFYEIFFNKIEKLDSYELINLYNANINVLNSALDYFKEKDNTFELLKHSIKNSFTKETSIIMNGETDNNREKQIKINSLEDKDNPIRLIFTVDMLNEGWDVLNLFDIVRLYDTRQGSGTAGKIGSYTIKEAQLIGRGARYCPFQISEEQDKFKRKYDNDVNNKLRILETMYFHSKKDSKYITELRQALIETGLQDKEPIQRDYILKETFKETKFFQTAYVFRNKRIEKSRKDVINIEDSFKNKIYRYTKLSNQGNIIDIMSDDETTVFNKDNKITLLKFKDIAYNILEGATQKYSELRFNVIKNKYPNVKSMKEFLLSDDYLGNSTIEFVYSDEINGQDLKKACVKALATIAKHIVEIRQEYKGNTEFEPIQLKSILKDKRIYLSNIDGNGGKGESQNNCSNENYQLNLFNEDWYVFNDNYGTSEEKLFLKFFKVYIEPKLKEKGLEFYVIRNERIPELAIYSFKDGERFEPDFLIFVKKQNIDNFILHQIYAEPKGSNLLEQDKWKEKFMLEMENKATTKLDYNYGNKYKIIGLPFYNEEYKKEEFMNAIDEWIKNLSG